MTVSEDELPTALRALSAEGPPQPADRLTLVTRRARRMRQRRTAAVMSAAAAATAFAVVPAALLDRQQAPSTPAVSDTATQPWPIREQTPLASWPDRSRQDDLRRAEGAYRIFADDVARARPPDGVQEIWGQAPLMVQWLFRGTVDIAPGEQRYVAAFMTPAGSTRWTVVATADVDDIDEDGNARVGEGHYGWTFGGFEPLPADSPPGGLGLYLNGKEAGTALFVLGDPLSRRLHYRTDPLPGAQRALGADRMVLPSGHQSSPDGVFAVPGDTPTGEVTIRLSDALDRRSAQQPLSTTSKPLMPPTPAPDTPDGFQLVDSSSLSPNTRYAGPRTLPEVSPQQVAEPVSVYVRCYGGGQLTVGLLGRTARPACDGDTHRVLDGTRLPSASRSDWQTQVSTTGDQRFHILIGSAP